MLVILPQCFDTYVKSRSPERTLCHGYRYIALAPRDPALKGMLCGAVKRQARQVVVSRYANAFNINESNAGWKDDLVREDSSLLVHCLNTHTHTHTLARARTHTRTHTHAHARTHTQTYTHTRAQRSSCLFTYEYMQPNASPRRSTPCLQSTGAIEVRSLRASTNSTLWRTCCGWQESAFKNTFTSLSLVSFLALCALPSLRRMRFH
jgi:hypothetical protein